MGTLPQQTTLPPVLQVLRGQAHLIQDAKPGFMRGHSVGALSLTRKDTSSTSIKPTNCTNHSHLAAGRPAHMQACQAHSIQAHTLHVDGGHVWGVKCDNRSNSQLQPRERQPWESEESRRGKQGTHPGCSASILKRSETSEHEKARRKLKCVFLSEGSQP